MSINRVKNAPKNDWPHYKRLLELCYAGLGFKEKFLREPEEALKDAGLILDAHLAKEAVEKRMDSNHQNMDTDENAYIKLMKYIVGHVHAIIAERFHEDKFADPLFKNWFFRQKNRILFGSVAHRRHAKTFYTPISFELTKGCSVGCPFCCLDSEKLTGCFQYSRENAELWTEILTSTRSIIGQAAGGGVCYFATEPFDNPDYEKFIWHFFKVFGYYPQTTTAKAVANPSRTKELLRTLGQEHLNYAAVRFSVISKDQFEKIHRLFTPEEIACVELLLNNPESQYSYSVSGRAIPLQKTLPDNKFLPNTTSICTIGFVVNMVDRSVKLVTPQNTSDQYTMGMRVYETVFFTDVSSYREVLCQMIGRWMKAEVPLEEKLCTGSGITWRRNGNSLQIQGEKIHRTIGMDETCYDCFIQVVRQGDTLEEIFERKHLSEFEGLRVRNCMQLLYDGGYMDMA